MGEKKRQHASPPPQRRQRSITPTEQATEDIWPEWLRIWHNSTGGRRVGRVLSSPNWSGIMGILTIGILAVMIWGLIPPVEEAAEELAKISERIKEIESATNIVLIPQVQACQTSIKANLSLNKLAQEKCTLLDKGETIFSFNINRTCVSPEKTLYGFVRKEEDGSCIKGFSDFCL